MSNKIFLGLLLAIFMGLVISFTLKESDSKSEIPTEISDYLDTYTVEGYVVSKRSGEVWILDEPVSMGKRIKGMLTSDYGYSTIIVTVHKDAEDKRILKGLNINEKIRVHGDFLRESYPARISAYHIEEISEE
ncbi:DUF3221 domain-containing protein [Robertmurraya massiliosenegalensis]|uniref:DUF3221 domain-containing protein n=1 Tax=Robertmurraya TaxID=2837507 RepID=UPI0039A4E2D2